MLVPAILYGAFAAVNRAPATLTNGGGGPVLAGLAAHAPSSALVPASISRRVIVADMEPLLLAQGYCSAPLMRKIALPFAAECRRLLTSS
jgi:hypothetical protein